MRFLEQARYDGSGRMREERWMMQQERKRLNEARRGEQRRMKRGERERENVAVKKRGWMEQHERRGE